MAKNHIIHTAKRPFGFRDILGYFMGDFGCNMSFTLISSYMFIFYTQYIGISLAHYSIIILITKIFDGINDPIIGAIVDRMGADKRVKNSNNGFCEALHSLHWQQRSSS